MKTNQIKTAPQEQVVSQAWWYITVITAVGRLRQEDSEFKVSLRYIATSSLKKRKHSFT
jgi:hypothetical protein